jgi:ornithine decarboxylase
MSDRIDHFLREYDGATPFLVVDLDAVRAQFRRMQACFPAATLFYAVKANPAPAIVAALAELGAWFDLASEGEIERCRRLGVPAKRCSFGNTVKRETDIAAAYADGLDLFVFDCAAELEKLRRAARGTGVFCRLAVENAGAAWPLSRKFGCSVETASQLLRQARADGLRPIGLSFHVGSQQTEPREWARAIARAGHVFRSCARAGIELEFLNLGGGLPAQYRDPVPPLEAYAETIETALAETFGGARPRILIEPGRAMVGDAGILRSTVLLISRRPEHAARRWVYLDAGRYNGLTETFDERIRYRLRTVHDGSESEAAILAGPTCDSMDVIYDKSDYALPCKLAAGDQIDFLSAGAYTASYASVEFNGFAPIKTFCI